MKNDNGGFKNFRNFVCIGTRHKRRRDEGDHRRDQKTRLPFDSHPKTPTPQRRLGSVQLPHLPPSALWPPSWHRACRLYRRGNEICPLCSLKWTGRWVNKSVGSSCAMTGTRTAAGRPLICTRAPATASGFRSKSLGDWNAPATRSGGRDANRDRATLAKICAGSRASLWSERSSITTH